jgi:hypothetical protein
MVLDIERVTQCLLCVINPTFGVSGVDDEVVDLKNEKNAIEQAMKEGDLFVLGPRIEFIFEEFQLSNVTTGDNCYPR